VYLYGYNRNTRTYTCTCSRAKAIFSRVERFSNSRKPHTVMGFLYTAVVSPRSRPLNVVARPRGFCERIRVCEQTVRGDKKIPSATIWQACGRDVLHYACENRNDSSSRRLRGPGVGARRKIGSFRAKFFTARLDRRYFRFGIIRVEDKKIACT